MQNFEILESSYLNEIKTYDGKIIKLELKKTNYAEERISDIQTANPETLPELTAVFLNSCYELNYAIGILSTQLALTKHQKELVASHTLIEKVPILIEQSRQRSSEDLRSAFIEIDENYKKYKEIGLLLDSVCSNLKDRRKVIEMAYFSCQKLAELKKLKISTASYQYGNFDEITAGSEIT